MKDKVLWNDTEHVSVTIGAARAAIAEYRRLGDLNSRNAFAHSSGSWKLKIKLPAELVTGSLLGLQMAAFTLYSHVCILLVSPPLLGTTVL